MKLLNAEADVTRRVLSSVQKSITHVRNELSLGDSVPLKLLVGVSGGIDSVVLLSCLAELQRPGFLEISVAHVDHGLRDSSVDDARFVEQLASDYRLNHHLLRAPEFTRQENIEAWARRVRYRLLREILEDGGFHFIATAHHSNDQAETVLFRFLTGRMATDARAIAFLDRDRRLFRPMLKVTRELIEEYVSVNEIDFVYDQTNSDLARTRNRIRHQLLPELIRQYNPALVDGLCEFAERLRDDEEVIWLEVLRRFATDANPSQTDYLSALSMSHRWRMLALLAEDQIGAVSRRLGYRALQRVVELIEEHPKGGGPIDIGFGVSALIHANGQLSFFLKQKQSDEISPSSSNAQLDSNTSYN